MRLLTLLTVTLFAGTASAEPPPLPFEVVRTLPETKQVLVYDRAHNTHVLLAPGSTFEDFVVVEISGVGLTLEKQQERFTVYPRAARGLALELEPRKNAPPVIYSKSNPVAGPAQVAVATPPAVVPQPQPVTEAAAQVETAKRVAANLASLLTRDSKPRAHGPSPAMAKLKP